MQHFRGKARGILWKVTQTLEDLEYADDICLLSHKYDHMQSKLIDLHNISQEVGLEINYSLTEEIQLNIKLKKAITLEQCFLTGVPQNIIRGSTRSQRKKP
jgi:hypothetical protein